MKKSVYIVAVDDPTALPAFVAARLEVGEVEALSLIARGAVEVAGQRADKGVLLRPGQKVIVRAPDGGAAAAEAEAPALPIVLCDAHILVVDKPAGLLSQPAPGEHAASVEALIQKIHPGARLLHRLDRDASGLLLLALHPDAHAALQHALDEGRIERRYLAVCAGRLDQPRTIRLRIARDPHDLRRRRALPENAPGGQPATTHIVPLGPHSSSSTGAPATRVGVELETGRTHQIRVHLAAFSHPLLGDRLYGGPPAPRLLLHAAELVFPHPATGFAIPLRSGPSAAFA